jgi:hypothetical protein
LPILQAAARALGLTIHVLNARGETEIDTAFATNVEQRSDGLMTGADAFFTSRHAQFAAVSKRYALSAIFHLCEFTAAGALMSYSASLADSQRLTSVYVGRVLRGRTAGGPADRAADEVRAGYQPKDR